MPERVAATWARVADDFTDVAVALGTDDWDRPSPCEGWTARDVVRHLVDWVPPFLASGASVEIVIGCTADEDPARAWGDLDRAIRSVLDDPDVESRRFSHDMAGDHRLDEAIDRFIIGDVLIHTWDLAETVGRPVALDPAAVAAMLGGLEAAGDALVASGHYGPPVGMPPDADSQSRLLAASGRRPGTHSSGPRDDARR